MSTTGSPSRLVHVGRMMAVAVAVTFIVYTIVPALSKSRSSLSKNSDRSPYIPGFTSDSSSPPPSSVDTNDPQKSASSSSSSSSAESSSGSSSSSSGTSTASNPTNPPTDYEHEDESEELDESEDPLVACGLFDRMLNAKNPEWYPHYTNLDLLVGVMSAPTAESSLRRHAIRKSWATFTVPDRNWKHLFVLGFTRNKKEMERICKEAQEYQDIIILTGFEERYRDLPLKVLYFFEWADLIAKSKFVMKTDDDSFVHVPRTYQVLEQHRKTERFFWGTGWRFTGPHRAPHSQWWVSERIYAACEEREINFDIMVGAGYVLSSDLVAYVAGKVREKDYRDLAMEDVTMGYTIREQKPNSVFDSRVKNGGDCAPDAIIIHYSYPPRMLELWEIVQRNLPLCSNSFIAQESAQRVLQQLRDELGIPAP